MFVEQSSNFSDDKISQKNYNIGFIIFMWNVLYLDGEELSLHGQFHWKICIAFS